VADDEPQERWLAKGHAITDTAKVPPKPDGEKPNRWPLVNDELAINCSARPRLRAWKLLSQSGGYPR
jgi:hypothetical protein